MKKAHLPQTTQMLGDGRLSQRQRLDKLATANLAPFLKNTDQGNPSRMRKSVSKRRQVHLFFREETFLMICHYSSSFIGDLR